MFALYLRNIWTPLKQSDVTTVDLNLNYAAIPADFIIRNYHHVLIIYLFIYIDTNNSGLKVTGPY